MLPDEIGGRAADERDGDREGLVEEPLLAVDLHHAHELLGRARVDPAAALARIDEGAQARPWSACRRGGPPMSRIEVRDDAQRQVVGLDLVVDRQRGQLRHQRPVAADRALDQPRVGQAIEARVPCRRRARPRTPASGRAGAGRRGSARSSAAISSSGVPMPTKPEHATVSPSRIDRDGLGGADDLVLFMQPLAPDVADARASGTTLRLGRFAREAGNPRRCDLVVGHQRRRVAAAGHSTARPSRSSAAAPRFSISRTVEAAAGRSPRRAG